MGNHPAEHQPADGAVSAAAPAGPVPERRVRVGFAFALASLVVVGAVAFHAVARLREDARRVAHTREVIAGLERLLAATVDAQNGHRGFALTGDESYLEPRDRAVALVPETVADLRRLTADNPAQRSRLDRLAADIATQLGLGGEVIAARRSGGLAAAQAELFTRRGLAKHAEIARTVAAMRAAEEELLAERERRTARSTATAQAVIVAGTGLATVLVAGALQALRRDFAGRRAAELALRRSENRLAVTLHSIGDAVLATDTAGCITRMNRVAEELTGWPLGDAAGRPVAEIFRIVNEHTRAPATIPVDAVLKTGRVQGLANHTVLVARDGTERAIADSAAPIRDGDGTLLGVVLVFRDVTAERAAERQLAAAHDELARERARLRFIFDTLPVGISFSHVDAGGRRTRLINEAHLRICGITRAQADEPGIFERLTHPDDRAAQASCVRQLEAGAIDRYTVEKRYARADGRTVWVILSYRRLRQADGGYEDLSSVIDISERRGAEEKIRRHNVELRMLFESLPGLFLVLKPDFTIAAASDSYLRSTMTRREEIVGRSLFDVFPDNPADPAATGSANLRASLERVRRDRVADTMAIQKYDVRRPDGTFEERFWSPINSPMTGPDGELEYIIHRAEDVTDFVRQKSAVPPADPAALRIRAEQLEAEIFRSAQRLQAANRELQALNGELEVFAHSVSHDLRAPLRHVAGFVTLLAREIGPDAPEKTRRYVRTIAEATHEMGQLIEALLAFSKSGRATMKRAAVDPAALVAAVRAELELTVRDRPIRWEIGPLPAVQGDAALLRQVFANLIGNAVKYTRGRDPAVIAIGSAGEEEGLPVFHVRDNGAGFDMRYADKLFGVFQRLHGADEFEGTGIGLANVRRIVARHGGRTWAEGAVGTGATFYFTLPAES